MNISIVNDANKLADVISELDEKYKCTISGYIDGLRTTQALELNKEKAHDNVQNKYWVWRRCIESSK